MKNIKIFQGFTEHMHKNLILYMITLLFLCIGIVIGIYTVKYMGDVEKGELVNYLVDYSKSIDPNSLNKKYVFLQAAKNNISIILIIWFLGLTMLGTPFILVADLIKGFTIGFTSGLVINGLGTKGILLNLLVVFPQNIIYIPCIIISSVFAMEFSLMLLRSNPINPVAKGNNLFQVATYSTLFLFVVGFMFIGFILEGYLTPNIIKLLLHNLGSTLS
ncbi:stage II sporulation protein M [Clostridium sp. JNZ J1-5]